MGQKGLELPFFGGLFLYIENITQYFRIWPRLNLINGKVSDTLVMVMLKVVETVVSIFGPPPLLKLRLLHILQTLTTTKI